ncbi:MAG: nucleotidyltransferase family protein [Dictyoglomus sp.]|nr:nucleotidyltransferase family protein [Dictyoglomus sp.]MCX7942855.1 nucleotidyltransferase family protein [Dictyoglomaceae bacterium]MDW8189083.1 nucleotidyltransferase family protein [Dictyoglomus sp.]
MKGVILSAGLGKRLRPLTDNLPKGLIPVLGKPILEYILLGFKYAGIKDIAIIIGYLGEKIKDYFKDGKIINLNISYIIQEIPKGTGAAVLKAKDFVGNENFMLSWGDVIVERENYINIKNAFEKNPCDVLMGLNYEEDLSQGGAVFLEEKNNILKVKDIIEKPKEKVNTNWNQTGIFILKPIIFKYLEKISPSERGEYEFTSAIKMMLEDNLDIRPFIIKDFHWEFGTLSQIEKANNLKDFLKRFHDL